MGIETAVLGGTALLSGLSGSAASRQAASMQADAADRATALQAQQAAQAREDLSPWRESGVKANNALMAMLGLDGSSGGFSTSDPSYQFRFSEGQKAVDNSAAARGSTLSGAALKALTKYGQDAASTEYQNQFNRLSGVSGQGQNAASGMGSASMNFGNSAAQNTMSGANALASGVVGSANAWGNAASSGIKGYQQNELMKLIAAK